MQHHDPLYWWMCVQELVFLLPALAEYSCFFLEVIIHFGATRCHVESSHLRSVKNHAQKPPEMLCRKGAQNQHNGHVM